MDNSNEAAERFAGEMLRTPGLIKNLLELHPPTGVCTGCKPPGSVRPIAAPCSVRLIALYAKNQRR